MAKGGKNVPSKKAAQADVDVFLEKARKMAVHKRTDRRGRLLFAMDATASRRPAWDMAAQIQGEMFRETAALGDWKFSLPITAGSASSGPVNGPPTRKSCSG